MDDRGPNFVYVFESCLDGLPEGVTKVEIGIRVRALTQQQIDIRLQKIYDDSSCAGLDPLCSPDPEDWAWVVP